MAACGRFRPDRNSGTAALDPEEEDASYPFPFHPLELGEAALLDFFGYQLEGILDPSHLEPEEIPLNRFKRSKSSWWKVW